MKPFKINITIYQGSTFSKELQWSTQASETDPKIPVNITGYKFRMQVREKIKDETFVLELTTENGGVIITDAPNGRFKLFINDTNTAAITIKGGVYDLEYITPALFVARFSEGMVLISPEVTR